MDYFIKCTLIVYFVCNSGYVYSLKHCLSDRKILKYYKIRTCMRSTLPIVSWANVANLKGCVNYVRDRNGLAFNFSPKEAIEYRENFVFNCQVLGCPETEFNSTTLVTDMAFDYYSAYGNFSVIENATCIRSIGLFLLIEEKENYTNSIRNCQDMGADLANVLSEIRTNQLSQYLNDTIQEWFKAAYVGLDDMEKEGEFRTPLGTSITCFRFRAWGPGHPRSKHRNEDCVVLDSDRMWKTANCSLKLPALCEFYPEGPFEVYEIGNITCELVMDKGKKQECESKKSLYELYKNSSRLDKCAILNYLDDATC